MRDAQLFKQRQQRPLQRLWQKQDLQRQLVWRDWKHALVGEHVAGHLDMVEPRI